MRFNSRNADLQSVKKIVPKSVSSTVFQSRDYECDELDDPVVKRIFELFPDAKIMTGRVMPRRWREVTVQSAQVYIPTPLFLALQIPDQTARRKAVRQLIK